MERRAGARAPPPLIETTQAAPPKKLFLPEQQALVAGVVARFATPGARTEPSEREHLAWALLAPKFKGSLISKGLNATADGTLTAHEHKRVLAMVQHDAKQFHAAHLAWCYGARAELPRTVLLDLRAQLVVVVARGAAPTGDEAIDVKRADVVGAYVRGLARWDPDGVPGHPIVMLWRLLGACSGGSTSTKVHARRLNFYGAMVRYALRESCAGGPGSPTALMLGACTDAMDRHPEMHKEVLIQLSESEETGYLTPEEVRTVREQCELPVTAKPKPMKRTAQDLGIALAPFMDVLDEPATVPKLLERTQCAIVEAAAPLPPLPPLPKPAPYLRVATVARMTKPIDYVSMGPPPPKQPRLHRRYKASDLTKLDLACHEDVSPLYDMPFHNALAGALVGGRVVGTPIGALF